MPTVPKYKNEVHIAGELAANPQVRHTLSGKSVCTLTVVTKFEKFSEYHRIVCWEQLAQKAAELAKGDFCRIVGRLQTRSWEDKQAGQKKYSTEIICWQLSQDKEPITPDYDRPHGGTEAAKSILKPPQLKGGPIVNAHGLEVSDEDVPF